MFNLELFNNQVAQNQTLLAKALTTTNASALLPENLDKEITNILQRLSPEISLLNLKKISGNKFDFNRYTALPSIGGAIGESANTQVRQSTYARAYVYLKEIRRKGRVTDFLQDASEEVMDAIAIEMENHLLAHIHDIINYSVWGNGQANSYEFSGLDFFIGALTTTNHYNRVNQSSSYGSTPTSISELDAMIDYSNRKGGDKHARCLIMSPEMSSLFSRLITNVRDNREVKGKGMEQVLVNGGWRLWAYRDIPIIESSSVTPVEKMPTVSLATAGTGSGLGGAADLFFKVAAVTKDGEQLACTEVTTSITTADTITLSWTPYTDSAGIATAYRYKIYCSNTTGTEKLVKIIPGHLYDSSGGYSANTTSVTFSTNPAIAEPTISAPSNFAGITGTVPLHMRDDIPYDQESSHAVPETIFLWDLDPVQGLGQIPYTNTRGSQIRGLVTSEELAKTDAWREFLLRSTMAMADRFEGTSYIKRGLRTY